MEIAQTITFEHTRQPNNDKHCDDGHGGGYTGDHGDGKPGKRCDQIIASFSTNDLADAILVKGTHDQHPVDTRRHQWESGGQYESLQVTLLYIKAGKVAETVEYDKDGKRIVPVSNARVQITSLSVTALPTLDISIKWTSVVESSDIVEYQVHRLQVDINDDNNVASAAPLGVGKNYEALDQQQPKGTFTYNIYAQFADTINSGGSGLLCGSIPNVTV